MCGIAGYFGRAGISEDAVQRTLALMNNRGPDIRTAETVRFSDREIRLLHARLAIIDLDPRSNQPFTIGDVTLIFNGEIYNYVELRERLEKKGITFRTTSDTEVLLLSYLQYGEECVKDFEGMWAFAIVDRRTQKVFLSRDRFGEKPLYYFQNEDGFYFGSEIKFLSGLSGKRFQVNEEHLFRYLVNGYKALYKVKQCFFRDIHEVPSGSNLVLTPELKPQAHRYWTPQVNPKQMSLEEAIRGARECLFESVKIRLRADVPLAFCLSGGVDSSALVSIAAKQFGCNVNTFSIIDPDERYNERENIQATIDDLGCKNTVIEIPKERSFERLRQLIRYHDSPIATITYYIHSFLSEAISKAGCKVVFSGTSADELFTGYYDHFNLHLYEMQEHPQFARYMSEWKEHIGKFVRNPFLKDPELYFKNPTVRDHVYLNNDEFASYLKVPFQEEFTEERFCKSVLRNRMLNELFVEATPVILHEDDLNSMKYSLENRSPYLDTRLFNFAYSIPAEHLIRNGYGKYILREAVKGILNDTVRLDRQKKGFNAAVQSVFDLKAPAVRDELLSDSPVFTFVQRDQIERLLASDESLPNSYSKFLFSFINMKLFLEEAAVPPSSS